MGKSYTIQKQSFLYNILGTIWVLLTLSMSRKIGAFAYLPITAIEESHATYYCPKRPRKHGFCQKKVVGNKSPLLLRENWILNHVRLVRYVCIERFERHKILVNINSMFMIEAIAVLQSAWGNLDARNVLVTSFPMSPLTKRRFVWPSIWIMRIIPRWRLNYIAMTVRTALPWWMTRLRPSSSDEKEPVNKSPLFMRFLSRTILKMAVPPLVLSVCSKC